VSAAGGVVFLTRRSGYDPKLVVEDPDRERAVHASIDSGDWIGARLKALFAPTDDAARWPSRLRGTTIGLGAGLLGGVLVGTAEGAVVVASAGGDIGWGVLTYGAISYGLFCMLGGAVAGLALAWVGRAMKRPAVMPRLAYAHLTAAIVAVVALGLGAFRIRRDVFHEVLVWKSLPGVGVLLGCLTAAAVLYLVLAFGLGALLARRPGQVLLRAWGFPAVATALVGIVFAAALLTGNGAEAARGRQRAEAPPAAGNVLFIVVDTLRADHLPAYGYERGATPHLDAFVTDAVRFDQFFANSSWTRPSFASILTGRYASSHGVMSKADQLPDAAVTLPEALADAGFYTSGFVTNYNVAPYFNFQQGFDEYTYLEPEFVLGADDAAAKLLLVQFLRQSIEKAYARMGRVDPGSAYQDAETVNREIVAWLDHAPEAPWMVFAAYMDPHDPYYEHPYSGSGYARAAHQNPRPEEAPRLRELYDGEITYWDEHFGRLVEDLKSRGLYDDLTIVVTSDHGEEFHDHGGFWHGTTLYDEQLRVPLFVKLPGNARGGTSVRHWAQTIDLMPTLLQQLGVPVPEGVQGVDIFEGSDRLFAEESHEGNVLSAVRERTGTDEHKLITANAGNPRGLPEIEVFDVIEDPGEQHDLSTERHELTSTLAEALVEASRAATEGALEQQVVEMDETTREHLCRIGYLSGPECDR
jgi:arylsulfatase A-like enzyme